MLLRLVAVLRGKYGNERILGYLTGLMNQKRARLLAFPPLLLDTLAWILDDSYQYGNIGNDNGKLVCEDAPPSKEEVKKKDEL